MKVATWRGGSRFTLDEAPDPVAGPGQVVVDVAAAGICGTDVHATQGLFPWTPPMIMGHEYSGVVREVGRGVNRRLIGRPLPASRAGCGACLHCKQGRISQCAKATRVGGFAERAALPLGCVHLLPKGLIRSPPRSPSLRRAASPGSRCSGCRATRRWS
jgi:L-iditol 2-dehydrogenase